MMKQMRKKAHLEEKYLVLGGFCPKNMVKEQFFCVLRGLKIRGYNVEAFSPYVV